MGAATRGQATIVLGQARSMGRRSRRLAGYVQVQEHRILAPRNGGIMRAVAADGPLQHGFNPSCSILDEIHAHRNDGLYTALTKVGPRARAAVHAVDHDRRSRSIKLSPGSHASIRNAFRASSRSSRKTAPSPLHTLSACASP